MKKAVIFDMDGVISDTQQLHAEVESKLLREFQIFLSPKEITKKYAGVSDKTMFKEILNDYKISIPNLSNLIFKKWDMIKEISKGKVIAIPHAIKLVSLLKKHGFKLAIASASTLSFIEYVVTTLAIKDKFDVLVSAQEVISGKPAPDIFFLAAERLKVTPKDCVVIEDGRSGMIGARAAGMKSVGFVASKNGDWPADILVSSLNQLNVSVIHNL
ncbi:HAD family phosphatase [Candidatus Daviesbacteria bacterium]|nr:HAD family phosphatase [Candidatus Daviesbacteria bacterium]